MMYRILMSSIMIIGLLLVDYTAALAQLYRYRDNKGNWCYTDNLADVPVDQQEDCKKYESMQPAAPSKGQDNDEGSTPPEEAGGLRDELKKRKAALDREYEELVKESSELEELNRNLKTEEARKEFETRKDSFNQRVKSFEEKRQAFDKDLRAYNDIIGQKKK
ncbi:MAG: hypothetical protein JJV98_09570 [Desulfosarcina sp.]|nr:hypothetical protein [Desulfobacterales bacterium]